MCLKSGQWARKVVEYFSRVISHIDIKMNYVTGIIDRFTINLNLHNNQFW